MLKSGVGVAGRLINNKSNQFIFVGHRLFLLFALSKDHRVRAPHHFHYQLYYNKRKTIAQYEMSTMVKLFKKWWGLLCEYVLNSYSFVSLKYHVIINSMIRVILFAIALLWYPADALASTLVNISPNLGKAPLQVELTVQTESKLTCTSFYVDWGDGSEPLKYEVTDTQQECLGGDFSRVFTHTYNPRQDLLPISYQVTVKAGEGDLNSITPIKLAVFLYGDDIQVSTSTDSASSTNSTSTECFLERNGGYTPFEAIAVIPLGGDVCNPEKQMKYQIDWGDGSKTDEYLCALPEIKYDVIRHTYTEPNQDGYTAVLTKTFYPNTNQKHTVVEQCQVFVHRRPFIQIESPQGGKEFALEIPINIKIKTSNLPGEIQGFKPKIRLLFLSEDGQVGYIGDINIDNTEEFSPLQTHTFSWIPTSRECTLLASNNNSSNSTSSSSTVATSGSGNTTSSSTTDAVCSTPIYPGLYKIYAGVIYDICNGDPFCGEDIPTVIATITQPIKIFELPPWIFQVSDRLMIYPHKANMDEVIYFTGIFNSEASCLGGVYTIDFGDGEYQTITYPKGKCESFSSTFSHMYKKPGTYYVSVIKNGKKLFGNYVTILDSKLSGNNLYIASVWSAFKDFIRNLIGL